MKTIKTFNQFRNEGAGFGTSNSNVPEGIPIKQEPQDSLMRRAKRLLGYDVKDLETAVDQLDNFEDVNSVIKKLNNSDKEEAKKLAKALLKTVHERFEAPKVDPSRYANPIEMDEEIFDEVSDPGATEDDFEDYLNGLYSADELSTDKKFEYLRAKADEKGDEWMYQGNTYGTLLRAYDYDTFEEGYEKYTHE